MNQILGISTYLQHGISICIGIIRKNGRLLYLDPGIGEELQYPAPEFTEMESYIS